MGLLDRLAAPFRSLSGSRAQVRDAETKGLGEIVVSLGDNAPRFMSANFDGLMAQGFERNPYVYRGIVLLGDSIGSAPARLYDAEGAPLDLSRDPLRMVLRKPSRWWTEADLWGETVLHLAAAGNAYWHKVRAASGRVVGLETLRPDRVSVVPDPKGFIAGFVYEVAGRKFLVDYEDIVRFSARRARNDYFGEPWLKSAANAISTDNVTTEHVNATLANRARPSLAFMQDRNIPPGAAGEDERKRFWSQFKARYGGENMGRAILMGKGDVKIISMSMKDLEIGSITHEQQARMLTVLGIPPILVGAPVGLEHATYSNAAQATEFLWDTTVANLHRGFAQRLELDDDLGGGDANTVGFDTSDVPAYENRRGQRWDRVTKIAPQRILTTNELRAEIGYPPVEGGDEIPAAPAPVVPPAPTADPAADPAPDDDPEQRPDPPRRRPDAKGIGTVETKGPGPDEFEQLGEILAGSTRYAEQHRARMLAMARRLFNAEAEDVLAVLARIPDTATATAASDEVIAALAELGPAWTERTAAEFEPVFSEVIPETAARAAAGLPPPPAGSEAARLLESAPGFDADIGIRFGLDNARVRAFVEEHTFTFARKLSEESVTQVRGVMLRQQDESLTVDETRRALQEQFEGWDVNRAENVARTETIRAASGGTLEAYRQAGVPLKNILPADDACPICNSLRDAGPYAIDADFIPEGTEWNPVDAEGQPILKRPVANNYGPMPGSPIHPQCRCAVVAVWE